MLAIVFLTLVTLTPDSTQLYYATRNVSALERACAEAPDRSMELLCRYRLYPLTEDERYLDDLPDELDDASARELALLAGLWGYRAARASFPSVIRHGMRASRLMEAAQALDPTDPYVLLIDGQSLLFRPRFAGGDREAALQVFRRLVGSVAAHPDAGISPMEAQLWIWYALDRLGRPEAAALKQRLLGQDPPPLYRQFLIDPP